ncbi:hypothetical protein [Streptomyces sp. A13(2022)]|uniref:hypothetical protein n=1 Tax=Streptomyces sp. A13(2022) TaxID=2964768 RepID=UPI0021D94B7B|nr:hypothetical protein [Streptomyces sp. A13(2022)]MCU8589355.1 hypothetical protein [Streptomyces sp. A13(2022)]
MSDATCTYRDTDAMVELQLEISEIGEGVTRLIVALEGCDFGGDRVTAWLTLDEGRRMADAVESGKPFECTDASGDVLKVAHGTLQTTVEITAYDDGPPTVVAVRLDGPGAVVLLAELRSLCGPDAEPFVPRTEREYWEDIASALNAAESVGMSVGIDLDGTLTDRRMWSVVWDRDAKQWKVAGYEDGTEAGEPA